MACELYLVSFLICCSLMQFVAVFLAMNGAMASACEAQLVCCSSPAALLFVLVFLSLLSGAEEAAGVFCILAPSGSVAGQENGGE